MPDELVGRMAAIIEEWERVLDDKSIIPRSEFASRTIARLSAEGMDALVAYRASKYFGPPPAIVLSEQDRRLILSGGSINGSHWSADLMRLIAKSDPQHRAALRAAFPSYVEAYEQWMKEPAQ